jgi:hypothetical protein
MLELGTTNNTTEMDSARTPKVNSFYENKLLSPKIESTSVLNVFSGD